MNLFLKNQIFKDEIADFCIASKQKCRKHRKSVFFSHNVLSSCSEFAVKVLQMSDANG